MHEETMRTADRRSRFANSTKIFVFATSSQKDEKKDEKKAAGIHKNVVRSVKTSKLDVSANLSRTYS